MFLKNKSSVATVMKKSFSWRIQEDEGDVLVALMKKSNAMTVSVRKKLLLAYS
jgi:hypothetical protein